MKVPFLLLHRDYPNNVSHLLYYARLFYVTFESPLQSILMKESSRVNADFKVTGSILESLEEKFLRGPNHNDD